MRKVKIYGGWAFSVLALVLWHLKGKQCVMISWSQPQNVTEYRVFYHKVFPQICTGCFMSSRTTYC